MVESVNTKKSAANALNQSMALMVIFEYFDQIEQIKMQALNKRFYNRFCPILVKKVALYELGNLSAGFVCFPKDDYVNILKPSKKKSSLSQWKQKQFEMASDTNWEGLLTYEEQKN